MRQGYEITSITPRDLEPVMGLVGEEGWTGYSVDDLALVLRVSPEFCFKLAHDGRLVGAVFALGVPRVAYVSFFLIKREHRRFESAMALGQRSVSAAREVSRAVVIYANRRAVTAYTRVGFLPMHPVTRYRASLRDAGAPSRHDAARVARVGVEQVRELDAACYRTDRSRLLSALLHYEDSRYYGYYPEDGGSLAAYAFVRRGSGDYIVGPLVATSAGAASALLLRVLAEIPARGALLDVNNESLLAAPARGLAFEQTSVTVRKMYMGDERALEDDGLLYGLGGHHFS